MHRRKFALLVFFLVGGWCARGMPPAGAVSPWSHFDKTSGLVDNTVRVIVPGSDGKLWIGTRNGLSVYDGEQWKNLTKEDGLPDNDVNSIFHDPRGQTWLGTRRGFGLFRDGQWSRLGLPGAGEGERVSVVADSKGGMWFGYVGGLMRFDAGGSELMRIPELEGVPVTALLAGREGGLWAGTAAGLRHFDGSSWESHGAREGLSAGAVTVLLEDSRGTVWAGTEEGLSEYDGIGWTSYGAGDDLPNTRITALAEDREGRVWIGTEGGAGYYDGYEWIWLGEEEGIPSEKVFALSSDGNGSIWIGTSHGLAKYDTSWSTLPPLGYDEHLPRAPLLRGSEGLLYVGTGEGFLEIDGRWVDHVGPDSRVEGLPAVIFEDEEDDIWVGTDRGLYLYSRGRVEHFSPPEEERKLVQHAYGAYESIPVRTYDRYNGLKGEQVTALWGVGEESMWVGTVAGLSRYRGGQWDLLEDVEALGRGEITALAGKGEDLWVGTADGLWSYREEVWAKIASPGSPADRRILSLLRDDRGNLWVGTEGGAFRWDGVAWERVGSSEELVGERIFALFQDRDGVLWFGTEAGVTKYDGTHWSSFSEADGLHVNLITAITEVDGELWFGSPEGVTIYRPDRAPPDTRIRNSPQEVVGTSFYLFEFAGSDFETAPHQMRYSWRLDDGAWSPFTEESRVTVNDLVNGTHSFAVRSMDQGLNVDPLPAQVTFQVDTGLFDLELVEAEFRELYASLYQFYATDQNFEENPVARIRVRNKYDRPLRVKASLFIQGLMDFPTDHVVTIEPEEVVALPMRIELGEDVLALEKTTTRQVLLTMQYNLRGELKESASSHGVTIFEKHSMTWEEPDRIGLYITHLDETVESFARGVVRQFREDEKEAIIYDNLLRGIELFDALGAYGVRYIADPENPYGGFTVSPSVLDLIRFPPETLRARAGDCDDVSVLYAALLQNIGIDTALVDVYDHVFVMFDTGLKGRQSGQLTRERDLLFIDEQDRVWVPVETTLLGKTFTEAWRVGARMLKERQYKILEVKEAWRKYAPIQLREGGPAVTAPGRDEIWALFKEDLRLQEQTLVSGRVRELQRRLREDSGDVAALNTLAVLLAKNGYLRQAAGRFSRVIGLAPSFPGGHSNLGNVLYEQGRYEEAIEHYHEALALDPDSPEVHVELALTYCEVGRFDLARKHYRMAMNLSGDAGPAAAVGAD